MSPANAVAMPDGPATCATSCPAMPAARNMDNARMAPASAPKDGMAVIARCVSVQLNAQKNLRGEMIEL